MTDNRVRLDRWLWAARFFKTRALSAEAIAGGKVHVNGTRAKAAKQLQVGDELRVRVGPYEWLLTVTGLSERRGPPAVARTLYEESPEGRAARERLAEQHKIAPAPTYQGKGRPTKTERRELLKFEEPDVPRSRFD
ncbi:MAG TPA: RNA-binding S4 domain-containing protein [Gammaproteobacteria bacterium]|nr:RNA-binding S4 domain-containing protein [Gammaproteobacteria bacterium]